MAAENGAKGGVRGEIVSPILALILGFVTLGIYFLVWMFQRAAEMQRHLGREIVSTALLVVGICCVPVHIYNIYLFAKALPEMQEKAGLPGKDDSVLLLILCIFGLFPVAMMIIQGELNKIWEAS